MRANAPVGNDLQLVEVTLHQTASPKPTPDLVVKLQRGPVMCSDLRKVIARQRKVALQRVHVVELEDEDIIFMDNQSVLTFTVSPPVRR